MRQVLQDDALRLVAETNDQRRCVGKALHYLHRSLLMWRERGKGFFETVKAFAPGAAAMFAFLEARLRRLPESGRDERLRRWLAPVLVQLAGDLERGERMVVPFARWIEARFPELTALMRREAAGSKIHDADLARELALAFGAVGRADCTTACALLHAAAEDLVAGTRSPRAN